MASVSALWEPALPWRAWAGWRGNVVAQPGHPHWAAVADPPCACCLSPFYEQANFHTTLSGQSMISLIYHKKLDDEWKQVGHRVGWELPPLGCLL